MKEVVSIVEDVFREHGEKSAIMPPKINLKIGDTRNSANAMPAYLGGISAYGIKWAAGFFDNPRRNLPSVVAQFILNDPFTGAPLAIMGASTITAMRTGAAAAVGAKYLARKDSSVIAIVGTGIVGRMSLEALGILFNVEEVRVSDVSHHAMENLVSEMGSRSNMQIRICNSVKQAVEDADIIVTATTADEPLVAAGWVKRGIYIASLGTYPELETQLVTQADKIVVDSLPQNQHRGELASLFRSGKLQSVHAELGDITIGKKAGRTNRQEQIIACLIGMGSEDLGVAAKVFEKATMEGFGNFFAFMD